MKEWVTYILIPPDKKVYKGSQEYETLLKEFVESSKKTTAWKWVTEIKKED